MITLTTLLVLLVAVGGQRALIAFLLVCVVVAGIYGAATVKRSILFVQALPAATALLLLWLSR